MNQFPMRYATFLIALLLAFGTFFATADPASAFVTVTGKVTLPDGAIAVSGASVNIHDASWSIYQSTTTSSSGVFTFNDLPSCSCKIEVYANNANYADPDHQTVTVTSGQQTDVGAIKLVNHNVIGTLKSPDGSTGISSIGVSFQSSDYTIYRWFTTDSAGQMRFRVPSIGSYTLRISSDFTSGSTTYFAPADQTVSVTDVNQTLNIGNVLMKNANVTGKITDTDGTTAIANAYISARTSNWSYSRNANSKTDGTFGLYMPAGSYTLEVSLPNDSGANPAPVTFSVTDGQTTSLGTIKKATTNVFFKVTQSDGSTAVGNANINVHTANWGISKYTTTAANGTASIYLSTAGTYTVEIWANSSTESNPAPFAFTFTSGNIYYDGTNSSSVIRLRAPSMKVTVQKEDATKVQYASVQLTNSTASVNKWCSTDANGNCVLEAVASGTYTLEVTPPWDATGLVGPDKITVNLTEGVTNTTYQTTPLVLTKAKKTLKVKVVKPNGTAITDGTVSAWKSQGSGWTSGDTNSSGETTLTMGSGDWNVTVYQKWTGAASSSKDWNYFDSPVAISFAQPQSVLESKETTITVAALSATISGSIRNPDGSIPSGYTSINISRQGSWNYAQVGFDGNFSVNVAPGTYNIDIYSSNSIYAAPEVAPVSVKDGEKKSVGTLTFVEKKEFVKGSVTDSNGKALASQSVNCWKPRGGGYAWSTSGSDGKYTLNVSPGSWICDSWPTFYGYGEGTNQQRYVKTQDPQEITINALETKENINFVFSTPDAKICGAVKNEAATTLTDIFGWVQATRSGSDSHLAQYSSLGGEVQAGLFCLDVPAGTYNLGMWMPYGSGYTAKSKTGVTVASGKTVNDAVITVTENNATLNVTLRDGAGNALTKVTGSIYTTNGSTGNQWGQFKDGAATLKLSADTWEIGYWINPNSGYMDKPLGDKGKVTLKANETKAFDITLLKLDSKISGTAYDPTGKRFPNAFISIDTELGGKKAESSIYDIYGGGFSRGNYSDSDGNFSIDVPAGKYFVTVTASTSYGYINPVVQEVTTSSTSPVSGLEFKFRQSDATVSGSVTLGHTTSLSDFRALNHQTTPAYVSAWTNGGFAEQFTNTGSFTLNITKGEDWHLTASYESGQTYYTSKEFVVTVDSSSKATQNIEMNKSSVTMPPAETQTFPSNVTSAVELDDGTTVNVPANSLSTTTVNVTVTAEPTAQLPPQTNENPVGYGINLEAVYASGSQTGEKIAQFPQDVTLTLPYTDTTLKEEGVTDESKLEIEYFDTTSGSWRPCDNTVVNEEVNTVSCTTDHFTSFSLVTSASSSVAPTITLTAPTDGTSLRKNSLTVSGSVTDAKATVTYSLNSGTTKSVTVKTDGTFSFTITNLKVGSNTITLNASNTSGSAKAVSRTITYTRANHLASADRLVITPMSKGGPQIIVADRDGTIRTNFFAFDAKLRTSVRTIVTDLNDDGFEEIIAVPTSGFSPQVRIFDLKGNLLGSFYAYDKTFKKGIHIIAADVDADGEKELITAPQAGGGPEIRVFDSHGKLLGSFLAGTAKFRGGLNIASAELDGDREAEILVTDQSKGTPQLRIYDGEGVLRGTFDLFPNTLRGAFHVIAADTDGDGKDEIVAAAGQGKGPQVRVFTGKGVLLSSFFAVPETFRSGILLSAGDLTGDGKEEIVVSAASNGGPLIQAFDAKGKTVTSFFAYEKSYRGSFATVTTDLDKDGYAEIVVTPGPGFGPQVRIFNRKAGLISSFMTHLPTFRGGITVSVNN